MERIEGLKESVELRGRVAPSPAVSIVTVHGRNIDPNPSWRHAGELPICKGSQKSASVSELVRPFKLCSHIAQIWYAEPHLTAVGGKGGGIPSTRAVLPGELIQHGEAMQLGS